MALTLESSETYGMLQVDIGTTTLNDLHWRGQHEQLWLPADAGNQRLGTLALHTNVRGTKLLLDSCASNNTSQTCPSDLEIDGDYRPIAENPPMHPLMHMSYHAAGSMELSRKAMAEIRGAYRSVDQFMSQMPNNVTRLSQIHSAALHELGRGSVQLTESLWRLNRGIVHRIMPTLIRNNVVDSAISHGCRKIKSVETVIEEAQEGGITDLSEVPIYNPVGASQSERTHSGLVFPTAGMFAALLCIKRTRQGDANSVSLTVLAGEKELRAARDPNYMGVVSEALQRTLTDMETPTTNARLTVLDVTRTTRLVDGPDRVTSQYDLIGQRDPTVHIAQERWSESLSAAA